LNEEDAREDFLEEVRNGYSVVSHFDDFYRDERDKADKVIYHPYFSENCVRAGLDIGYRSLEAK